MKCKDLLGNALALLFILDLSALSSWAQTPPSVTNGRIGLWHLDGNTTDASGNGHNGTISGTVTQTTGKYSSAYHFNGSSWIDCGNVDLNTTGEFSVSAWVKSNDTYVTEKWRMVVSKLDPNDGGPLELFLGDGRSTTGLPGTATNYLAWDGGIGRYNTFSPYDLSKNAKDGNWHHLAITFKSGLQIVYFDGVQVASTTSTAALPNTSSNFNIGGIQFGAFHYPLIGDIDEVSAYNRALTSTEIKTLAGDTTIIGDSGAWNLTGNSNATSASKLGTTNSVNLRLYTNNAERVRILSSNGYVGIGTTTPSERLHVNGVYGANALRVQVAGTTKLLVASNGGVAIGGNTTPPINGLYVNGSVGIGTASPQSSAELDLTSTTRGLLVPRMTKAQRTAISSPARGLLVFQTDGAPGFYYYDSGWRILASSAAASPNSALTTSDNSLLQDVKAENEKLQEELTTLKQTVAELKGEQSILHGNASASLEQNAPNPFSNITLIRYRLPANASSPKLVITDIGGRIVESMQLGNKGGMGQVTLNAGTLAAGTYNYSLYIDNNQVDSKKLVITR